MLVEGGHGALCLLRCEVNYMMPVKDLDFGASPQASIYERAPNKGITRLRNFMHFFASLLPAPCRWLRTCRAMCCLFRQEPERRPGSDVVDQGGAGRDCHSDGPAAGCQGAKGDSRAFDMLVLKYQHRILALSQSVCSRCG